jgi:DNA-binding CsgD family transcriptional regulator
MEAHMAEGAPSTALFEATYELVKAAPDVGAAVTIVRDQYNVANVTYHLAQTVSGNVDAPFVRTTYPDKWVSRYLLKDYVKIDPIVQEGFARQLPFDWSEVEPSPAAYDLLIDAIAHGLGAGGYSIPITDRAGRRALFSFNTTEPGEAWTAMVSEHREYWAELGQQMHRKAIFELHGAEDPMPQLSPRELECLYWTGQGKESKEIAIILSISDHTARSYLKSARYKLDCANLTKAVTKAIKLRMINP